MDKQKFTEYCQKNGLPVEIINGVVMLCYDRDEKETQIEQFQKLAKDADFQESRGWCLGKSGKAVDKNE